MVWHTYAYDDVESCGYGIVLLSNRATCNVICGHATPPAIVHATSIPPSHNATHDPKRKSVLGLKASALTASITKDSTCDEARQSRHSLVVLETTTEFQM